MESHGIISMLRMENMNCMESKAGKHGIFGLSLFSKGVEAGKHLEIFLKHGKHFVKIS